MKYVVPSIYDAYPPTADVVQQKSGSPPRTTVTRADLRALQWRARAGKLSLADPRPKPFDKETIRARIRP